MKLNRMKAALDLMEERMEQPLSIDDIAKAAYSSPFHFQRMFHMVTGMTVAEYMRKRRLTLAAQELAMSSAKVIDVALKYGYDSPESFAKAFRKLHGISPSEARDPGVPLKAYPRISFQLSLKGDQDMDYRIVEKEAFTVAGKSIEVTCGDGENLRRIPQFWVESSQDGTVGRLAAHGRGKPLLGICEMLPDSELLRYSIAVEAADGGAETANGGAETANSADVWSSFTVPAATWAVFTSVGPMPGAIQAVWGRVFQEWFPATGYEHAAGPELEVYPEGDTTSADYRCEVWVPIVKR